MKNLIFLFFLLSGCAGKGHEGDLLSLIGVTGFTIVVVLFLSPLLLFLDRFSKIDNKLVRRTLLTLIIFCIVIFLDNLPRILIFLGKVIGFN